MSYCLQVLAGAMGRMKDKLPGITAEGKIAPRGFSYYSSKRIRIFRTWFLLPVYYACMLMSPHRSYREMKKALLLPFDDSKHVGSEETSFESIASFREQNSRDRARWQCRREVRRGSWGSGRHIRARVKWVWRISRTPACTQDLMS